MSGRFVSGGTISAPGAGDIAAPPHPDDGSSVAHDASAAAGAKGEVEAAGAAREMLPGAKKNRAEWETVRQELEEDRRRREAQRTGGAQEQSLYDILQANKAAKQAAFEEQNKLKNQFRPLDDDEVHFLDEVMAKERDEEARLKRETEEGLRVFRLRQKSGGGVADDDAAQTAESAEQHEEDDAVEDWAALGGRKRKRVGREGQVAKGVKRKSRSAEEERTGSLDAEEKKSEEEKGGAAVVEQKQEKKKKQSLVAYDSDEDD